MSGVSGTNQDVDIDLGRIVAGVWQRKGRILGATFLAAGIALVATSLMKPSYRGETRLLIESRSPNLTAGDGAPQANDPILDSLNITSQAQVLQSTDLIKQVIRDLKLADVAEFDPAAGSLFPDPLVLIGIRQDPMLLDAEDRVIREFRDKLQVYPVENSRIIAIEFSSHDPKLAAAIPNKMAAAYLQIQSSAKLDTHSQTAKWLEPEIARLTSKVKEAETKVADYRSANGLFRTSEAGNFSSQQLNDISTELARLRAELANAEARAENVRNGLRAGRASDTLTDVVGSQVIQRLKETEANLQAQISDQQTQLLEGHPRLRGLRAQLSGIRQQIEAETRKILASLDNEAEVARLRERQLITQLNGLKADSARSGEEEVGLRALEREAVAQRQLLETYLARYREATSRLDGNAAPADARVVSLAGEPSEPYFPKIIPIVVVAGLATFIIGCLAVVVAELFSGRALRPSHDVGTEEGAPIPGQSQDTVPSQLPPAPQPIPQMQAEAVAFDRSSPTREDERASAAEVRARVKAAHSGIAMEGKPAAEEGVDGFTIGSVARYIERRAVPVAISVSPGGDDGSAAAVMLAREIADSGRGVVLIDMTGSACPTRLMVDNASAPGITDLLCGESAFGDSIHGDRLSDAHIIPHGSCDPARAMRGVDRLAMVIDALADAYDIVLIECGPAELSGLARLGHKELADLILSVPGFEDEDVAELVRTFEGAGYRQIAVMTEAAEHHARRSGRRAA